MDKTRRLRLKSGLAVLLILATAVLWWGTADRARIGGPGSPIHVSGNLSQRDLIEIRSIVRRDLWRQVLPTFSWWTLRDLPRAIRSRAKEHVFSIGLAQDGTVELSTQAQQGFGPVTFHSGHTYVLKRNGKRWEILRSGFWEE